MSYTPEKTVVYEGRIRKHFCEAIGAGVQQEPFFPKGSPVEVVIEAYYRPPARTSRKRLALMHDGRLRPLRKPDVDNIVKAVCDALNGWAYHDDSQVVHIAASKFFSGDEGVWITVRNPDGGTD